MDTKIIEEDAQWVSRIRQGDETAFEELARRYYSSLFDFASSITHSSIAAEDTVQDVLIKVWENRKNWNPGSTAKAYLFRAVRNRALNYLRDRRTRQSDGLSEEIDIPSLEHSPDADLEYSDLLKEYATALKDLPERRRLVYTLSRIHGLSYDEIAQVLDVSVNTVRTQMTASLQHFRNRLKHHLEKYF